MEGAITEVLWDIFDASDDGDYYLGSDLWGHNLDSNSNLYWNGKIEILNVLYSFDPQPDNPDHDYCWNIYEFIHGWRKLGYPTDSTFINILEAHNVRYFLPGDYNHDEYVNIMDIIYLIDWKMKGLGVPPVPCALADVNADCNIDILDITYLIDYKFDLGPEPLVGCYEDPLWPQTCQ